VGFKAKAKNFALKLSARPSMTVSSCLFHQQCCVECSVPMDSMWLLTGQELYLGNCPVYLFLYILLVL